MESNSGFVCARNNATDGVLIRVHNPGKCGVFFYPSLGLGIKKQGNKVD